MALRKTNTALKRVISWLDDDRDWLYGAEDISEKPDVPREETKRREKIVNRLIEEHPAPTKALTKIYSTAYTVIGIACCITLAVLLLFIVAQLPDVGVDNMDMHEVTDRYITNGLEETGAVNIVAGIILDYRAFDTLGESFVLFSALSCVIILLRSDGVNEYDSARYFQLSTDRILKGVIQFVVPVVIVFGIYVLLNGHLSPGGGFSGGAILGAGLILMSTSFGGASTSRIITDRVFKVVTLAALSFYCLSKSYSFFTGANGLNSVISAGTPGNILSAGLILPLNIAVGLVVSCTMYGIYRMFKQGRI